ncbi:hypothetical protein KL86SPO_50220 [uncultured Sporomusa sp.]|uniref:Uncharacterized protein n=1 Tax=uncultured Sporomusa sp. TaxID=307249 RepID=A0A212LYH2_9FIRM|nr:hypothetical protein [uncultured Sporomusa sp.]SCM82449.1 hypothetical protein KL86SPO_50220 [uncultured Sporomusa sp.]
MAEDINVGGIVAPVRADIADFIRKFDLVSQKVNTVSNDVIANIEKINAAIARLNNQNISVQSKSLDGNLSKVNSRVKSEQAGIETLNRQYDRLYRNVGNYIESNTKMSALSFTRMKNNLAAIESQMAARGVSPAVRNPLAQFGNYNQYAAGFNNVANSINRVQTAASGTGLSGFVADMGNAFAITAKYSIAATAIFGVVDAMQGLISTSARFASSMETNQVGISGILMSMTQVEGRNLEWNEAMSISSGIIKQLNDEALKTAATSEELVNAFRALLGPGLAAKMTIQEIAQLSSVGVNAVKSLGLNQMQIVQELRDLVQGGIQPASSTLAVALGLKDKDIKEAKESSEGLFKFLMERMKGFQAAAEYQQTTMRGRIDQITEIIQRGGAEGIAPAYAAVKNILDEMAQSAYKVDEATGKITINPEFVATIRTAADTAVEFGKEVYVIGRAVGTVAVPAMQVFGGAIKLAAENASTLATVFGVIYGARQVSGMIGVYSDIKNILNGAEKAQTAFGQSVLESRIKLSEQAAAAKIAGAETAASAATGIAGQRALTTAVNATTAAHIQSGAAAKAAGATTVSNMAIAGSAVRTLTGAIWALAGGWAGVAVATGLAISALIDYQRKKDGLVNSYNPDAKVFEEENKVWVGGSEKIEKKYTKEVDGWVVDQGILRRKRQELSQDELKKHLKYREMLSEDYKPLDITAPDLTNKFDTSGADKGKKGKSEYEKYKADTKDWISTWQQQLDLEQLTYAQFAKNVQERLDGLKQVSILEDEQADAQRLQMELQSKIRSIGKQQRQESIELANHQLQLGKITLQQYADEIEKQFKLAESDKERRDLAIQNLQAQRKLLDEQLKNEDRLLERKQATLALTQEQDRHNLEMVKIFSDSSTETKLDNLERERTQTLKNLANDYKSKVESKDREIAFVKQKGEQLSKQDEETFENLLNDKKKLDEKYKHDSLVAENDYAEKVAQIQKSIIDANNDMILGIIDGTKSGHDILDDMWSDFAGRIIAQNLKITSSMNIFDVVLGPMFGLNKGVNLSGTRPDGVQGPVGSNGGFYKKYAGGGLVLGPGTGTSDSILLRGSNGEYMVSEKGVKAVGVPFLDALNAGKIPGFANGGIIPPSPTNIIPQYQNTSNSAMTANAPNITLNVVNNTGTEADVKTSQPQFDGASWVCDVVLDKVARSPVYAKNMRAGLGV